MTIEPSTSNHPTVRYVEGLKALLWLALSHGAVGLVCFGVGMWTQWAMNR